MEINIQSLKINSGLNEEEEEEELHKKINLISIGQVRERYP